ncbi:ATP-binding protein [Rickettsiales bacterium]|nr:ATP-binding protein [Rickettsiales bacterium]
MKNTNSFNQLSLSFDVISSNKSIIKKILNIVDNANSINAYGINLFGPRSSGKTAVLNYIYEDIKDDGVVFFADKSNVEHTISKMISVMDGKTVFDRSRFIVVIDDIDSIIDSTSKNCLFLIKNILDRMIENELFIICSSSSRSQCSGLPDIKSRFSYLMNEFLAC